MKESKIILIVDDDPAFVESHRDLLEAYGYRVFTASNGQQGLDMARRIRPDLMILDVMMATQTEGFEVARKIPELPELRGLRVILVTGIVRDMHLPFGFEPDKTWLPVDRVLDKPVAPDRLLAEIERLLQEPKGAAEHDGQEKDSDRG